MASSSGTRLSGKSSRNQQEGSASSNHIKMAYKNGKFVCFVSKYNFFSFV